MQEKCSKCNSEELFVEIQGNRRGLYCGKCVKCRGCNRLESENFKRSLEM